MTQTPLPGLSQLNPKFTPDLSQFNPYLHPGSVTTYPNLLPRACLSVCVSQQLPPGPKLSAPSTPSEPAMLVVHPSRQTERPQLGSILRKNEDKAKAFNAIRCMVELQRGPLYIQSYSHIHTYTYTHIHIYTYFLFQTYIHTHIHLSHTYTYLQP